MYAKDKKKIEKSNMLQYFFYKNYYKLYLPTAHQLTISILKIDFRSVPTVILD